MVFGFKLHALTNLEGLFARWALAAANQADVTRRVRPWLARELTDPEPRRISRNFMSISTSSVAAGRGYKQIEKARPEGRTW